MNYNNPNDSRIMSIKYGFVVIVVSSSSSSGLFINRSCQTTPSSVHMYRKVYKMQEKTMIKKISWIIYLLNCFGVSSFLSHCIRVVVCMFFSICWLRLAQSKSEFVAKIVEYFHEFKENNSAKRCTQTFTLMKRNLIETIDFILIAMWRASSIATSICING